MMMAGGDSPLIYSAAESEHQTSSSSSQAAGPSHDDSFVDLQPKRKRFHAFRIVHKIFRRKSKRKYDDDGDNCYRDATTAGGGDGSRSVRSKSRSTSELAAVDCRSTSASVASMKPAIIRTSTTTTRRPPSSGPHSATGLLSLSHDSVFAPGDDDDDEDPGKTTYTDRKLFHHSSRRRFSVKGMKEELMSKLRARRDQSEDSRSHGEEDDDDPGLPHSPGSANTSPTTAEVLGHGLLDERVGTKRGSKLRNSDNSLLSMGSSETDNEIESGGVNLMLFDRRQNADPELDLGPTILLNHRAAHHRIAIKPRRTHAVPKHRRLHQVTSGSGSLPMTPEEVSVVFGESPSKSDEFNTTSESSSQRNVCVQTSAATDSVEGSPEARYGLQQRQMSDGNLIVQPSNPTVETMTVGDLVAAEDVDVDAVTTSCFGFGLIGRTRKPRESVAPKKTTDSSAAAAAMVVNDGEELKRNLSKFFGSRLGSRRKKLDSSASDSQSPRRQSSSISWTTEVRTKEKFVEIDHGEEIHEEDSFVRRRRQSGGPSVTSEADVLASSTNENSRASLIAAVEAKRKSVQQQLTKEDIDELESFSSGSRRSLLELHVGNPSPRPPMGRRPFRFSLGSAKDIERLSPGTRVHHFSRIEVHDDGDEKPEFNLRSRKSPSTSPRRTSKSVSEVITLDVAWSDEPASSKVEAIPPPPQPLRRHQEPSSKSGGGSQTSDEPELLKVFHRRSLKLKDTDDAPHVLPSPPQPLVVVSDEPEETSPRPSPVVDEQPMSTERVLRHLKRERQRVPSVEDETVMSSDGEKRKRNPSIVQLSGFHGESDVDVNGSDADVEVRRKVDVAAAAADDDDDGPLKEAAVAVSHCNASETPPIIQISSKPSSVVTRSSKVLDLVRNFQKLQAT